MQEYIKVAYIGNICKIANQTYRNGIVIRNLQNQYKLFVHFTKSEMVQQIIDERYVTKKDGHEARPFDFMCGLEISP